MLGSCSGFVLRSPYREAFDLVDPHGSGAIDVAELRNALGQLGVYTTGGDVAEALIAR